MGQGFYSTYFLIPKKDGGLRPILNLKGFNRHLKRLLFHMLNISTLLTFIRQGDWFTTVDLQDAYFHIPIHRNHRKYLRFYFQGNAYEYNVLPFGLSLAPRTFTKCMDAALIPLRRQGIRIANYLDDWLICSPTEQQARNNTKVVLTHLQNLGLKLNSKKSCLIPTKAVTYLGLTLDSTTMRASLTSQRQLVLEECLSRLLWKEQVTVKFGRRLLGLLAAASQVVPLGLLHMRPLQLWLAKYKVSPYENGQRLIPRDRDCLPTVQWWLSTPGLKEGVTLGPLCSREMITTDASLEGWGAVWRGNPAQGQWDASWKGAHINLLELEAVFRALIYFRPRLREKHVIVRSDSTTVVSYINHQGGLRSTSLYRRARDLLLWAHAQGVSLRALHLPGEDNVAADLLSRGGPRPGEWRLHPAVVQEIWSRFGVAQVDLFASLETTHCPLWYSIVGPKGSLGVDALANKWPPMLLYAFPPFPLLPVVLAKVRILKAKVLLVAPDWPQQAWMPDLVALQRGPPWRLPVRKNMLSQAQGKLWHPNPGRYNLHVWPLDGSLPELWERRF